MTRKEMARHIVKQIVPNDYKISTHDAFEKAATKLLKCGFSKEETQDLLCDLRIAVAEQYGD